MPRKHGGYAATTVQGALQSNSIGAIRFLLQGGASPQKVRAAIKRAFQGLTPAQHTEVYNRVTEPYRAGKAASALAENDVLGKADIPVKNPPRGTLGLGTTKGIHYNITIDYTLPGDATVHHAQWVEVSNGPLSMLVLQARVSAAYVAETSQSTHPFTVNTVGVPRIHGITIRSVHRVTG